MNISNNSLGSQRKTLIRHCIDSIEGCLDKTLINIISPNLDNLDKLLSEKSRIKHDRWIEENADKKSDINSIILNIDFSEKVSNISRYKDFLEPNDRDYWIRNLSRMNSINVIRNLVFHRSSETEDIEITEDHKTETWDHINFLRSLNSKVWEPLSSLTDSIDFLDFSESVSSNLFNFKSPDYLIHGFVGRHKLFTSICDSLTESSWNAVLIYGPGGVGKSALADYVCRHLDTLNIYDKIIWFSDKRRVFDLHGSRVINEENISSLESFKERPIDGKEKNLKEICSEEKCLIVLDNLETMIEEGKNFIQEFSDNKTQFLITSRVNDCPGTQFRLSELEEAESLQLFNNISIIYNIREALSLSQNEKNTLLKSIEFHPLYIKWILFQLQKGEPISRLKENKSLIKFCFDGLIENISEQAKTILKILEIADREMNLFLLQILLDTTELEKEINDLIKTSLIKTAKKYNSRYISLNSNVKTILKERSLEDLRYSIQLENLVKSMYKGLSKISAQNENLTYTNPDSYDIENENDAAIVWHINEIKFQHGNNHEEVIKKMKKSLEIAQSFHLHCRLGNYYAENDSFQESISSLEKAYDVAYTNFRKKKALHFLIQSHENIYDYKSCLDYALKLNSIDQDSEIPKYHLLSSYFGTFQFKKALDVSSKIFENIDIKNSTTYEINSKFTSFIKVIKKSSNEIDDYHEYKNIHDVVYNYVDFITPRIDQWSLKSLLKFLQKFYSDYSYLCERLMFDPEFDTLLIKNRIIEILQNTPKREKMTSYVMSWQFGDEKIDLENIPTFDFSEDTKEARLKNLNSEVLNLSFEKKQPFDGSLAYRQTNRKGELTGYYIRNDQDDALCFCFASELPEKPNIGFKDSFVCIKKDNNNFVVKRFRNIVEDISQEFIDANLKPGSRYSGVVSYLSKTYVIVEISVFGRNIRSMLHRDNMNTNLKKRFNEVLYKGANADFKILNVEKDEKNNLKVSLEI